MENVHLTVDGVYNDDLYKSFAMRAEQAEVILVGRSSGHIYFRGRYICRFSFIPPLLVLSEWQDKVSSTTQAALIEALEGVAETHNESMKEE